MLIRILKKKTTEPPPQNEKKSIKIIVKSSNNRNPMYSEIIYSVCVRVYEKKEREVIQIE